MRLLPLLLLLLLLLLEASSLSDCMLLVRCVAVVGPGVAGADACAAARMLCGCKLPGAARPCCRRSRVPAALQLLASALVVLWALRLGGFLCYRSFKWVAQRPSRLLRCKLNRSKEAAE